MELDRVELEHVEQALREVIAELDYDLHKGLERDESDGRDRYPALAYDFMDCLRYAQEKG